MFRQTSKHHDLTGQVGQANSHRKTQTTKISGRPKIGKCQLYKAVNDCMIIPALLSKLTADRRRRITDIFLPQTYADRHKQVLLHGRPDQVINCGLSGKLYWFGMHL